ncbi:HAD family hydrolase [Nocardiopsis ansamitocini]|uniref:Hydrolase of the HAD superfamily n=1 Tax=Nocardiopsis ansamitocini TaxID=1670832 RepID=A0A9W6P9W2_9ACTN|nr:HAD family phosphatase [Nocardiopsis ansamitocini]GLU49692.1 hypothetical protein Nans01_40430 [Nocardiopsis ansamitocini]
MTQICRGIITDWGGVLTSPLPVAIETWLETERIDRSAYLTVMRDWLHAAYAGGERNLVHALERGEVDTGEFEQSLAGQLRLLDGGAVPAAGLIERMFAGFLPVEEMYTALREARAQGVRTCLLSNSWGNGYPQERFADTFDAVVISGEVGMRKPEPEIFAHALELVGLPPEECVFIDDIEHNVTAAQELGMVGIVHTDPELTRKRLEEECGVDLTALL